MCCPLPFEETIRLICSPCCCGCPIFSTRHASFFPWFPSFLAKTNLIVFTAISHTHIFGPAVVFLSELLYNIHWFILLVKFCLGWPDPMGRGLGGVWSRHQRSVGRIFSPIMNSSLYCVREDEDPSAVINDSSYYESSSEFPWLESSCFLVFDAFQF